MNIDSTTALQIAQIIMATLIAIVSPFYPRFSLFTNRVRGAMNKLVDNLDTDSEFDNSTIEYNNTGFEELLEVIEYNHPTSGKVCCIGIVLSNSKSELEDFVNKSIGSAVLTNVIIYVEYKDGSRDDVVFNPFDPNETMSLRQIKNWTQNRAVQRANYITMTLVIIWTSISIYIVL